MSISLIIPAYNEAARLPDFLKSIIAYHKTHPDQISEILIVDDGSSDPTVATITPILTELPIARLLKHTQNQGKGAAVQTGVMAATGNLIIFIDADGATDISQLPKMITALGKSQIAIGNRWMSGATMQRHSLLRALSGWLYRNYMKMFGLGDIDTMCGFKGYQADIARDLFQNLQEKRWLFDTEVAYKARQKKYTITNFPIQWESKDGSKLDTITLIKSAMNIFPLIIRLKRQYA